MKRLICLNLVIFFAVTSSATAAILRVPRQHPTIQSAIDAANAGDTVIVAPGRYTGDGNRDIDFLGKAITVRSENGPENCIIDCNGTETEPHRGFLFHNGEDANSILDGFTIRYAAGEAILCGTELTQSPTITNCKFIENYSYAISIGRSTNLTITNCEFIENHDTAICNQEDNYWFEADLTLENCTFIGNSGFYGGAIQYTTRGSLTLENCTFINNSSKDNGGAIQFFGPCYPYQSSLMLKKCTFINNSARGIGGAICAEGNSLTLQKCTFTGNSAVGLYPMGGAIWCEVDYLTAENCIFANSSASHWAGAVFAEVSNNAFLANCTITSNSSRHHGGIYFCNNGDLNIELTNCILWNNSDSSGNGESAQIWLGSFNTALVNYNCVQGWTGLLAGIGNTGADPCFVDPVNGDYHLLQTSPCINAGDPNHPYDPNETDLDGNPRIIDGRIDMGALEYLPPLEARLLIRPRTINRRSRQRHIMAWLSLPAEVTRDDIDENVPLTLYPGQIEASRQFIFENNRGGNTHTFILAFFKKSDLMNAVPEDGQVQLEAVGQLNTGRYFFGQHTVRIINPPHRRPNPNYKKDAPTKARSPFD